MKRFLKIFGGTLVFLLILLAALPFVFKDKIEALFREEIKKNVNAEVYFSGVDLSFFRNFPDVRVSVTEFGVVNYAPFEGDTLAAAESFDLVVDLMSVISGETVSLKKIILDKALIHGIVHEDGQTNWDIVAADTSATTQTTDSSSAFRLQLQSYEIKDTRVRYEDATIPVRLSMDGLTHKGSGDFSEKIFELDTETEIRTIKLVYDNVGYLNGQHMAGDIALKIDISRDIHIEMKDNVISVNDFALKMDGDLGLSEEDVNLNLRFSSPKTDFRSLFSLIPAVYTESFSDTKTKGSLDFDGFVQGTYNENSVPGFGLNLKVADAWVQYPDLPESIDDLQIDVSVSSDNNDLENMKVQLRKLQGKLGSNPFQAQADITGIDRIRLNGKLTANLDLAEVTKAVPIEGTILKGKLDLDATADGTYDATRNQFPTVDATATLVDGYVKNEEYPAELSDLRIKAILDDADGKMESAVLDIPEFHFLLDGEELHGTAHVDHFEDPHFKVDGAGKLDLAKLTQVYPLDSMRLRGNISLNAFSVSGKYSDIEEERYTAIKSSGTAQIKDLHYEDDWYMQSGFDVEEGQVRFTESRMEIISSKGKLGKSDYTASGYIGNYLAYGLLENEPLSGKLTVQSNRFDSNEWMIEEEAPADGQTSESSEAYGVIPVPETFNLDIDAQIGTLVYEELEIKNINGSMAIAESAIQLKDITLDLLGANVAMNGSYDTKDLSNPLYNFYLDVSNLGVQDAATHFNPVTAFAPVTRLINGIVDTELGISGRLDKNMFPVLEDLNSLGSFNMLQGGLDKGSLLGMIAEKTKINELRNIDLSGITGQFEIEDGFLNIAPIKFQVKDIFFSFQGRQNLAGKLDYLVNIDAPPGTLGNAAFSALSNLSGGTIKTSERVNLNLLVSGTVEDPKIEGGSGGTGEEVKNQAINLAEDKLKEKTGLDLDLNQDSLKNTVNETKNQAVDSLKNIAENTKNQAVDSVKTVADSIANDLKKQAEEKAKEKVGEEVVNHLKDLKNKFGFGKKKKKKDK
ncbi:MAG: AsmA-like C-terminal region-containing protein [Bacteroidota bacterium]